MTDETATPRVILGVPQRMSQYLATSLGRCGEPAHWGAQTF